VSPALPDHRRWLSLLAVGLGAVALPHAPHRHAH